MTGNQLTRTTSPEDLNQLFTKRAKKLQMLPGVAIQALEIAKSPDCSIQEFVAVVERDVVLASEVLSLANSPLFSVGGKSISRLQQAVIRLGFNQCRNLILSSSIATLLRTLPLQSEWIRDLLWHHSFLTGILSMRINGVTGAGFQGEEFAAGLIHDIGRTVLAVCLPEQFTRADPLDFYESAQILSRESSLMPMNHCDAGSWFVQKSGLPEEIISVVRWHHQPELALNNERLVALTAVSDHMANYMQRHGTAEKYELGTNPFVTSLQENGVHAAESRLQEVVLELMTSANLAAMEMSSF